MKKTIYLLFILFANFCFAQEEKTICKPVENSKAQKLFEKGTDKKKYEFKERKEFLLKAIEEDPEYAEAHNALGNCAITIAKGDGSSYAPAKKHFEKAIELCPDVNAYAYFYLGLIAYGGEKFEEAGKHMEKFLSYEESTKKDDDYTKASKILKESKFYAEVYKNPVPFDPKPVKGICTYEDEFLAMMSPDNEQIYFTKRFMKQGKNELTPHQVEELEFAEKSNDSYLNVKALAPPFNVGDNYGGTTFSLDNKHMYITMCKPDNRGVMNCDIFSSDFEDGIWTELKNLGPNVNTSDGWESQPTLSSDGRILYFASARADSKGMDIYKSEKNSNGEWMPAQNLGAPVNTDGNEKSPFIHSDSQTLYFSSDGQPGLGGFDIFYTRLDMESFNWKIPKNLGYPINTDKDELGFFVSTDGHLGYFSSNQLKGKGAGGYDIFYFELYKEARPEKILFLRGELTNESMASLSKARIEIKNLDTKKITTIPVDTISGSYAAVVTIQNNEDVLLTIKNPGSAFTSEIIHATDSTIGKAQKLNLTIDSIKVGSTYKINNINYKTNSADLTPQSKIILEEFANYLKDNPQINLEIHGHTDNEGIAANNLALSTDRAFTVYDELQQHGITKDRMRYKGFGGTKPIAENSTEKGKAKNRRTEFVVLSY
jgi:outer membrane protein OmpA-like peptidoglycan-associated protein